MKEKEIFDLVNPLRTSTWKNSKFYPEYNEENYKLYYKAAGMLGFTAQDNRYPYKIRIRRLIRKHSFANNYWRNGSKKAITYRSNRIEENICYFMKECENKRIINWLYEVFNYDDYQTFGYVKAHSNDEAKQLADLMFGHAIKKVDGTLVCSRKLPLWKSEFDESNNIYIGLCLKAIKNIEHNKSAN